MHTQRAHTHTQHTHAHILSYASYKVLYICTLEVNKEMLSRSGFMDQFGKEWLFPSIEDAVRFATEGKKAVSCTCNKINATAQKQSIQIRDIDLNIM